MKRKNLLIVDDEKLFLKSVSDGLKPFHDTLNCNVITAINGREAMQILDSTPIDVVVTDIRMPEADGFKLITHMINNHPAVPVVVMTAFGSQDIEKRVREMGIIRYLEKPIDFDFFLKTIEDVLSLDKKEGRIEGIALSTFLQMMEMEKITCTLTITSKDRTGDFYIKSGNLVEAEYGDLKGVEAALEMLTWENVKINMKEVCKIREGSISQTLTSILLESFRRMDSRSKQHVEKEKEKVKTKEFAVTGKEHAKGAHAATAPRQTPTDDPATAKMKAEKEEAPRAKDAAQIDVAKLNRAMEMMKKNLTGSLLSSDIFHMESQQSLVGWNSNPRTFSMLSGFTRAIGSSLGDINYPRLDRYFLLDLSDRQIVIVIPLGDYLWSIMVDGKQAQLGLLINLIIPQAIKAFQDAMGN